MQAERIRYARSADGTQIAWTASGAGSRTLVIAANDVKDIQRDRQNPLRRAMVDRLSQYFYVVRYDHRGSGSSQRDVERQGIDAWVEDLAAVVEATKPSSPFVLFGCSQAGQFAPAYAAQCAERLSHLVLVGPFARGGLAGADEGARAYSQAFLEMIRVGWGDTFPGPRMLITAKLILDATQEEMRWSQEHIAQAAHAEDAHRFHSAIAHADGHTWLAKVCTPTLVLQAAEDYCVLPEQARAYAAAIPDAHYVEVPGCNHIPVARDPGFELIFDSILKFTGQNEPVRSSLSQLSSRELEILEGLCAGLNNEAIALDMGISAKTVRNHLTRVFDKLGVHSRTQAVAMRLRQQ